MESESQKWRLAGFNKILQNLIVCWTNNLKRFLVQG